MSSDDPIGVVVMWLNEHEYLQKRAEAELECAEHASHPAAIRAHYLLLGYYLNKLFPDGDSPSEVRDLLSN